MVDADQSGRYIEANKTIVRASLYLGAFAFLEKSVVDAVTFFYHVEDSSSKQWKQYVEEVTMFSDDLFTSSCIWLEKNQAIKHAEFLALINCKRRRDATSESFRDMVLQNVLPRMGDNPSEGKNLELIKGDFDQMVDLLHRIEAWRTAVDYGLRYSGEDNDLDAIFPVSVIGMMRVADLAFPKPNEADS